MMNARYAHVYFFNKKFKYIESSLISPAVADSPIFHVSSVGKPKLNRLHSKLHDCTRVSITRGPNWAIIANKVGINLARRTGRLTR